MAGVPRNMPLPRGTLAHNLGSYFINNVAAAAARCEPYAGRYAWVGLHNQAMDGRYLHVISLSVWCADPAGDVTMWMGRNVPTVAEVTTPVSVFPMIAQMPGLVLAIPSEQEPSGHPVWRLSGGGQSSDWSTDDPVIVLPPNWWFYTAPRHKGYPVSASFRWLALKP